MKAVNLYDLKQMGNKGGLYHPIYSSLSFWYGLRTSQKDYIEFKHVGIFDGKAVVTLRGNLIRENLLRVIKSIKQRQKLIAYRYKEGKLLLLRRRHQMSSEQLNEW